MTQPETLKIFERDTTLTPAKLRSIGYIPATVYGRTTTPFGIQLKSHELELALKRGVRQFRLEGFGQPLNVEVKQLQTDDTKGIVIHAEFYVPSAASPKKNKNAGKAKPSAENKPAAPVIEEAVPAG